MDFFQTKKFYQDDHVNFYKITGRGIYLLKVQSVKSPSFFSQPQELLEIALSIIKGKQAILQDIVSYTI